MNDLSVPPMNTADAGAVTARTTTIPHASDRASLKGRLLKNTAYPLPLLGAIRMGGIEVIDDRRLPVKDDAFSITTQARDADGGWVLHPLHQAALEAQHSRPGQVAPKAGAQAKLRAIPVRVMFDATDLTVRAKLEMISALTGGRLRGLPFWLVMRAKCSRLSKNAPFYYADLELGCAMEEVAARLAARRQADEAGGFDVAAFEQAVRTMLNNSAFEDTEDDVVEFEDLLIETRSTESGDAAAAAPSRPTLSASAVIAKLGLPPAPVRAPLTPLPALD